MSVLASVLKAVAQGWVTDRKLAQKLAKFSEDIAALRNKRGEFVHGLFGHWLGKPQQWYMFKLKSPKQRGNINADPVSPTDIAAFAAELRQLQVRAQDLTTELKGLHGSRP